MKVLIVEDNPILRENLIFLLKKFNFLWEWAFDWTQALEKVSNYKYDAIVLDVNLPIMSWKDFLRQIRERWNTTPVIALTSDSLLEDKLDMFELWVDDYLTKPFEIEELIARLKSILKRKDNIIKNEILHGDILLNLSTKKILKSDEEIKFPYKQYLIVEFLMKNKWFPQKKINLMEYVWWEAEENLEFNSTTLESHIYSIRNKLWKDFIKTIKWIWYIIE